jgi:hypothetical protein
MTVFSFVFFVPLAVVAATAATVTTRHGTA